MADYSSSIAHHLAQVNALDSMHEKFQATLQDGPPPTFGKFSISRTAFGGEVLFVPFNINTQPVFIDGDFAKVEYEFYLQQEGKKTVLFYLYMNQGGKLFRDSQENKSFSDYDSVYLKDKILERVASEMITAGIFEPHDQKQDK